MLGDTGRDANIMTQPDINAELGLAQSESIDLFATAIQFYRSALRRKWIVFLAFGASFGLAATYYLSATRLYASKAELIVLHTGGSALDKEGNNNSEITSQMPNYERILQSDNVLKSALKSLPDEHRKDFVDVDGAQWLEQFRSRMNVSTLRNTNVISISFRSIDPETAYVVVGSLVDSYLKFTNSMHKGETESELDILAVERLQTETELRSKESQLLGLKRNSQVLFGTNEQPTNVLSERVIALNTAYIEAKRRTVDTRALSLSIEQAVARGEDIEDFASQLDEGLGAKLLEHHSGLGTDDAYTKARISQDLLADQAELSNLRETHLANHPKIIELQDRIRLSTDYLQSQHSLRSAQLKNMTSQELGPRLVLLARRQFQLAKNHELEVYNQYIIARDEALRTGHQLAQIELLQHEVTQLRDYYNIVLDAIKGKSLAKESGISAEEITPPSVDFRPVTPKLSVTVLLALALGFIGGGVGVYVLDLVDDRFHSPDDLRITIGSPILAMIRKLPQIGQSGLSTIHPFAKPNSVESEAFRTLRTAIEFSGDEMRRITISSTEPSDGKTTVMNSLAVAFAQSGKRTLVIDGDMRRPGTTKLYELSSHRGLSNVLKDQRPVEEMADDCIQATELKNLFVMAAGPRPVNPVELLSSDRFAEFIAWAETQFDQLLIDAPPSLAVADVQVIGMHMDAAILIVRPDKNKRKMVIRAAESLSSLGCRLLGIVVNHIEPNSGSDYGYGYGYGYGEEYGHDADAQDTDYTQQAA